MAHPTSRNRLTWLLGVFVTVVVIRGSFVPGLIASDDSQYIDGAMRLAAGLPPIGLEQAYSRMTFELWLAFWLKLGLAPTKLWIAQLVAEGMAGVALFVFATRFVDLGGAALTVLIWTLMPVTLVHGSMVLPDEIALALSLSGATVVVDGARREAPNWKLFAAGGVLLGLAGSAKEPFGLVAPLLGAWILLSPAYRAVAWRQVIVLGVVAVLIYILMELGVLGIWTGDWQYRQRAMTSVYGLAGGEQYRVVLSLSGFSYYLSRVLLNPLWGGPLAVLALAVTLGGTRDVPDRWLLLGWAILFFLFFQFGSTDWRHYNRVPQQPRYVQLILIPMIVFLGGWLWRVVRSGLLGNLGVATLLLVSAWQCLRLARASFDAPLFFQSIPLALEAARPLVAQSGISEMTLPRHAVELLPRFIRQTLTPADSSDLCQLLGSPPEGGRAVLLPVRWSEQHGCGVHSGWILRRLEGPATILDRVLSTAAVAPLRARALIKYVGVIALPRAVVQ